MRRRSAFPIIIGTLAILALMLTFAGSASAQVKYRSLYRFTGGKDGSDPQVGFVFDQAGNLYGTTLSGGAQDQGTVFQLTPNQNGGWTESVLYSFCSLGNCADGAKPYAGVIFDQAGDLYGTTGTGGDPKCGCGTVFELTPNQNGGWTESVLFSFDFAPTGYEPEAGVIFDQAGNLYGTTLFGGAQDQGTVFQLSPNQNGGWTESVLYSFCSLSNCADGAGSVSGLIFDQAGNLYGTTYSGGANNRRIFSGAAFELSPNQNGGWTEKVLYSFCSLSKCADGAEPEAGLILDQAGNLYGTTFLGSLAGTVFELTPNQNGGWTESVLHKFCLPSNCGAGSNPFAGLVFDQAGNLYGTTAMGGANPTPYGVIFKMTPKTGGGWTYQKLHTFLDRPGARPAASLILDKAGNLYGTTTGDSIKTFGSVFEITP